MKRILLFTAAICLIFVTLVATASAVSLSPFGTQPTPVYRPGYTVDEYGDVYAPAYFADGTPIPADYVCPIHGENCPYDPRNRIVYRPPTPRPTRVPHEFGSMEVRINNFVSGSSSPVSIVTSRLSRFL